MIAPPNISILGCKPHWFAKKEKKIMWEVVARRCCAKNLPKKCYKIHREIPVLESLSNTAKCLYAVWPATLLKKNPRTGVSEPAVHRSFTK